MNKLILWSLLLIANISPCKLLAWCKKPVQLTTITINDLSDIRQLTFIHKVPKNKLDEYANLLAELRTKHLIDYTGVVDQVGALKTREAFCLLYFCCMGRNIIHDITEFDAQGGRVVQHGSHRVLNKYFLNGMVSEKLPAEKFREEVMKLCAQKDPVAFYCQQLPREVTLKEMKKINTKKYDNQVISIIKRNCNLRPYKKEGGRELQAGSRIKQQTMALDFVEDCFWDGCGPKIEIYPQPWTFGVIMIIDGVRVERCYRLLGATITRSGLQIIHDDDKMDYRSCDFCPGFVERARISCNETLGY